MRCPQMIRAFSPPRSPSGIYECFFFFFSSPPIIVYIHIPEYIYLFIYFCGVGDVRDCCSAFHFVTFVQPITGNPSDVHLAIEEIERRFRGVMQRHSPRKHLHMHVMAARVRLEMKSAFADVKERLKVRARPLLYAQARPEGS